jgi:Tol biopolymer transport system component
MSWRWPAAVTLCVVAFLALTAGPVAVAQADFTPFSLVSGSPMIESDFATDAAISADGRYVVFTGSETGVGGIYRRDLQTGELDLVAPGDALDDAIGSPSISGDGRYVSFTSQTDPVTGDAECSTVYVADMADPAAPTYTVASAPSGSTASLTYAGQQPPDGSAPAGPPTITCAGGGSAAAARVALSADGSEVAFTVVGQSDLTSGVPGQDTTPGAQVAVRNLTTDTTTLVTQTMASLGAVPQPVPGGGAITETTASGSPVENSSPDDSTAAISADGTTVAWLGIEIPSQAPASAADAPAGYPAQYDEPLWRRIADGPAAPIRRVTGGDDPACGCQGPLDTEYEFGNTTDNSGDVGPEQGSLLEPNGFGVPSSLLTMADATPQLSADGQTVAILSTAPTSGQDPSCPIHATSCGLLDANAFLVDMAPGLTRTQALTRLTQWASNDFANFPTDGTLHALAISPDGQEVAFVTERTNFPYSPPSLITPQLTQVAASQLYVADVADGTMQLVSTGYDGLPANGNVTSVAFSADDGPLALSSSATNLVFGALSDNPSSDNQDETFTTVDVQPPQVPGVQSLSPAPANPTLTAKWEIGTSVGRGRDGSVLLDVSVPGAGQVKAQARAEVPAGDTTPRSQPKRAPGKSKTSGPDARARVVSRTVARARATPRAATIVTLALTPAASLRARIARGHGLYATVSVRFTAAGHQPLTRTLPVDFVAPGAAHKKTRKAATRKHEHTHTAARRAAVRG